MISILSLIYKSVAFADMVYDSLVETTPELASGEAEFYFVANSATDEVKAHLGDRGIRFIEYHSDPWTVEQLEEAGLDGLDYIRRVYSAMNEGIRHARDVVCLISSDHVFTPGWLTVLKDYWNPRLAMTSLTIEPGFKRGPFPECINGTGAVFGAHGTSPAEIDKEVIYAHAKEIRREAVTKGGAHQPTLIAKEVVEAAGYFPEGNPKGKAGDRVFFAKMRDLGVRHLTCHESVVYHIGEGEMARDKLP